MATSSAQLEAASRLYRDISPPRAPKQMTSLPELFKKPGALQTLRPGFYPSGGGGGYAPEEDEVESPNRLPRLLFRLEQLLEEKLSLVKRVGAASTRGFAATQMRTDAYRQVFDAFLHSFTTYRSLLMRIKHEYDNALDDALASVYDNIHMRSELASSEEMMDVRLADSKSKALDDATAMRQELLDQYLQSEKVTLESEQRCQEADEEIQRRRTHIAALKKEAQDLMSANRVIKHQLVSSSSWARPELLQQYEGRAGSGGLKQR